MGIRDYLAPRKNRNDAQSSGEQADETPLSDDSSKRIGEPAAMSVAIDTLERTQAYDSDVPSTKRGPTGSGPVYEKDVYQKIDGHVMKFTHPSGSTPLQGFTIKRGVGVGGFGEVYFAVNDAGKEVALKQIQRNLEVEVRGVRQCLNLKHPNLIALYDIKFDDAAQGWIVMEYVSGISLRDAIETHPQGLPPSELQRWFGQIVAGVA